MRHRWTMFSGLSCLLCLLGCLNIALPVAVAFAGATDWVRKDEVSYRLISGQDATGEKQDLWLALQFQLAPGWKTYWRSPGESGIPMNLGWQASRNVADIELKWPAPQQFTAFGFDSYGYDKELILPMRIKLEDPGKSAEFNFEVTFATCKKSCIQRTAELALTIPEGASRPSVERALIERSLKRVPSAVETNGLEISGVVLEGAGEDQTLSVEATSETGFETPALFAEGPRDVAFKSSKVMSQGDGKVRILVPVIDFREQPNGPMDLQLTLVDGHRMGEFRRRVEN